MQSIKLLRQLGPALLCAGAVALIGGFASQAAWGFAVASGFDLWTVARWSNLPGSLVEQGVRGLGGGLEYAIAGDFCDRIIPRFIDEPKPTCEQLAAAIQRAFDRWAAGHPILKFVNVTEQIKAELPPPGHPQPFIGAEIDFFTLSPAEFPRVSGAGAHASAWFRSGNPLGTNGRTLPGFTYMSADIVFNADNCFYLDLSFANPACVNPFEAVVLHEIGHALGLGHPDEQTNYDTDDDPKNPIVIDCEDPTKGLRPSFNYDRNAIMKSQVNPEPELTNDDIGGRNFLYPICG